MADSNDDNEKRQRINSDFPKHTIQDAIAVAQALHNANGGQPLPPTETAIAIGVSPGSSGFRELLRSSSRYGLTSGAYSSARIALLSEGQNIVEPTSPESARNSIVNAALTPSTFRSIYDYFKGKKLPEATFFQNTIVREFGVPREHAEKCVETFVGNMNHLGLVRDTPTGRWLSSELGLPSQSTPQAEPDAHDDQPNNASDFGASTPPSSTNGAPPADQPKNAIFLGHGKNRKPLEQLEKILSQYKIPYKVAVDEPNKGRPISQKVADTMKECGAAILIFTADEEFTDAEGNKFFRPNENVIHELGASSVLYGGKIVIFKEDGVELSTNFKDIGYISFQKDQLSAKMNELFGELIAFGLITVTVGA